ncbi:MAG TPA: LPS assembly lipoprotein LptE [Candidatus Binatia bacterium]|nr:LPS assembly lipoprotein LptE [Candidatus Binatia bacterium]
MKRLASAPVGVARHRVSIKERYILKLIAIPLCLFALAAGCGYQFTGRGDAFPRDVRTVFVDPLVNRTKEVGVDREMTMALKTEINRKGLLRVVDRVEDADAILSGVIRTFDNRVVGVNRHDEALQYEFLLVIDLNLRRRVPDELLWRTQGARFTDLFAGSRAAVVTSSPDARALGYQASDLRRFTDVQLTETQKDEARSRLLESAAHDLHMRLLELF